MEASGRTRAVVRDIVARNDMDQFSERVLDSFWDSPDYRAYRPSRADALEWVRWNIDLVVQWLVEERPPTADQMERLQNHARGRAADAWPPDLVPANFRTGARYAWSQLLEQAREDERPALLESADLILAYIDRVSSVFSSAYETAAPAVDTEERAARDLVEHLRTGAPLTAADHETAERLGFDLEHAHRAFALAVPSQPVTRHAALARRLRAGGLLAIASGRRVVGLAAGPVRWQDLGVPGSAVVAEAEPLGRAALSEALDEMALLLDLAAARGARGRVEVEDHLTELLLARSPRLAARLRARVYGRLAGADPELPRTLDCLIEHDFDRAAAAAALPVHRNTLHNRLTRIREVTGLDVDGGEGRTLAWLAWRSRV